MQCILFGRKKKAQRLWDLECGFLPCLPARESIKKVKVSRGYQEDAVETRETMTWNHNCVFLIVWMGRKGERSPFLRLSGWAGEIFPGELQRVQNPSARSRKICATAQIHAHIQHALSADSRGARTKKHFTSHPNLSRTHDKYVPAVKLTRLWKEKFVSCLVFVLFGFFFLLVRHTQAHTLLRRSE